MLHRVHIIQPSLTRPFHRDGWVCEEKYDGWRVVAYKEGRNVRLVSRRGVDHTQRFADIAAAVARLPARTLILDGEVCTFDERLISHMHLLMEPPANAVITRQCSWPSNCPYVRGRDVRAESLGPELGLYTDVYSTFGQLTARRSTGGRHRHACKGMVATAGHRLLRAELQQAAARHRGGDRPLHRLARPGPGLQDGRARDQGASRPMAERELGPKFDIRAFHDELLGAGPLPLSLLETRMKAWMKHVAESR